MKMTTSFNLPIVKRFAYGLMAALMLTVSLPVLFSHHVSADQFVARSIKMSDSNPSGGTVTSGVGSGTNVTYQVTFTPAHLAASMILEFCTEDPIVSDTCTTPTSMVAGTAIANVAGTTGGAGWTLTAAGGRAKLADDNVAGHHMAAGVTQTFNLTGVTNPTQINASNPVGTFYGRMYTYTNNTWGTYASATSVGNYVDYGGVALSLTNVITITARVQETLTFCVTKAAPSAWTTTHDCSDTVVGANLPSIILGHGTPTAILDPSTVDTANIYTQLSTNATSGAIIRLRNSNTTCAGLSSNGGTTCAIPSVDTVSGHSTATPAALAAGTAALGLFVATGAPGTSGTGTSTADPAFHNNSHVTVPSDVWYGMNNDATTGVGSTFGAAVASTTGPVYRVENTYTFAATSALTTPAGIYTANMSMIATGTF